MLYCILLKGTTYYEKNTFSGIWGVVFGLWCYHTHTNFEKSLYMIFWVRYAFLKVPRLHLPNERVSFGAPSYVGRGHIWIFPPTSPLPSNQSIAKILWTSGEQLRRGELGNGSAPGVQSLSLPDCLPPPQLPDCRRSFGSSPEEDTWRRRDCCHLRAPGALYLYNIIIIIVYNK